MSPGRSRCSWECKHEIDVKSYNESVDLIQLVYDIKTVARFCEHVMNVLVPKRRGIYVALRLFLSSEEGISPRNSYFTFLVMLLVFALTSALNLSPIHNTC